MCRTSRIDVPEDRMTGKIISDERGRPISDDRGRFCSYNTLCGRKCTPYERDRCIWWLHAKDEPAQLPLELTTPFVDTSNGHRIMKDVKVARGCIWCGRTGLIFQNEPCPVSHAKDEDGE